jgi:hypothetical protein
MTFVPLAQFSENIDIWIFGDLAHPLDLHLPVTFQAEPVDPDAVFQRIDELFDLVAEALQGFSLQPALENGVLHPPSKILQSVGEAGSPPVTPDIIGDHDQHGNRKGS